MSTQGVSAADFPRDGATPAQREALALALEVRGRVWRALYLNDYRDAEGRKVGLA